ncbi:MAG: type II toxin-antitoxin system prevent-host-death family antitoxin [Opitutus sp.]|nr:type II toxin-antitoxin system prevent-host-death family antitoxin [Opitutus sp.]
MKTATIRQVKYDLRGVLALVEAGDSVEITRHGEPVATLSPPRKTRRRRAGLPDFAARLKEDFPAGPLPGPTFAELIRADRDRY